MTRLLGAAIATLLLGTGPLAALEPLGENRYINDRLFAAAVGDQIRKNCSTIRARLFYVLQQARALERYALDQGYSQDQIDAYLGDPDAKEALEAKRDLYLSQNGVVAGEEETYCALGRSEIAQNTITGTLLRGR